MKSKNQVWIYFKGKNICRNREIKAPDLNILDPEGGCPAEGDLAATLGSLAQKVRCKGGGLDLGLQEENQGDFYFFGSVHLQKSENPSPYLNLGNFI